MHERRYGKPFAQRMFARAAHAADICPAAKAAIERNKPFVLGYDRMCMHPDGRPKRWYARRVDAALMGKKYQRIYACPLGSGFHVGTKS